MNPAGYRRSFSGLRLATKQAGGTAEEGGGGEDGRRQRREGIGEGSGPRSRAARATSAGRAVAAVALARPVALLEAERG